MDKLYRGAQIAYVPLHAHGDLKHEGVQFGFITGLALSKGFCFCRYWIKGRPGELRTAARSEQTPIECLRLHKSVPDELLEKTILDLGYEPPIPT